MGGDVIKKSGRKVASPTDEFSYAIDRVFRELVEILRKENPELIPLYMQRFEYATDPNIPPLMRWHNQMEILKTYMRLKDR